MSRRLPRLVYTSVSLVIGAAADMSLVVMGGCHHPDNSVAASLITALLVPNVVSPQIWFVLAKRSNTCCLQDLNLKSLI